jgi:hypothetical protein
MTSPRRNAQPSCAVPADAGRAAPWPAGTAPCVPPTAAAHSSLQPTADNVPRADMRVRQVASWVVAAAHERSICASVHLAETAALSL